MTTQIAAAYAAANQPLTAVIDGMTPDQWRADSPCEGWTASDVVKHMIDTQRQVLSDRGVELTDAGPVEADPSMAWHTHSQAVLAQLEDPAVGAIEFEGYFGPTTLGETMETYYVHDMIAHRWDVAKAGGHDIEFSDEELDILEAGHAKFGDAMYMDGIYKRGTEPKDATRQERVLAAMGRDPRG